MRWLLRILAAPFLVALLLLTDYPKADKWKRPVFPHPETGEEQAWTRASTVAKSLDDGGGLINWTGAMVAGGCYLRPDIVGKVGARWPMTDANKPELYGLIEELKEAGGASVGRNAGDTLHEMIRRINQGEPLKPMPPWDADVKAYLDLVDRAGLVIDPDMVERTVCLPEIGVAGSFDLAPAIRGRGGELIITDLKTGKLGDYSWPAWVVQLAIYANADWLYDWDTRRFEPMPPVSRDRALILSLPAGSASAELYVVNISSAWKAV
jgi:hypothetical protein